MLLYKLQLIIIKINKSMEILLTWLVAALLIMFVAYLLPGVTVSGFFTALIAALVLGLVNAFIKPGLVFLTLPLNILTLGAFTFVLNALMIMIVAAVVPGFKINNFWWALLFSLILSLFRIVL